MCDGIMTNSILFLFLLAFNQQLIIKQPKDVVTIFKNIDPLRPYQDRWSWKTANKRYNIHEQMCN